MNATTAVAPVAQIEEEGRLIPLLWTALPQPMFGRSNGRLAAQFLECLLADIAPDKIINLILDDMPFMDYTFADEAFGALIARFDFTGEPRLVFSMDLKHLCRFPDLVENIDAALVERGLTALLIDSSGTYEPMSMGCSLEGIYRRRGELE